MREVEANEINRDGLIISFIIASKLKNKDSIGYQYGKPSTSYLREPNLWLIT